MKSSTILIFTLLLFFSKVGYRELSGLNDLDFDDQNSVKSGEKDALEGDENTNKSSDADTDTELCPVGSENCPCTSGGSFPP